MNFHQTSSLSSVASSSGFDAFVLNLLRDGYRRTLIDLNHIGSAGIALRDGWINGECAVAMLHEAGLDWVSEPSS
jgi:hypothetical protein